MFSTAQERASEVLGTVPQPVSEEALTDWLGQAPENARSLFIVAAAVYSALQPPEQVVRYSGREVAGLLSGRVLEPPTPDIVAAAFAVTVLARDPERAPSLVWAAVEADIGAALGRLVRVAYDAEVVIGFHEQRLGRWLATATHGQQERVGLIRPYAERWPQGPHAALLGALESELRHTRGDATA